MSLVQSTDFFDAEEPFLYSAFNLDDRIIIINHYDHLLENGEMFLHWQFSPNSSTIEELTGYFDQLSIKQHIDHEFNLTEPFWKPYFTDLTIVLTFDIVCPHQFDSDYCKALDVLRKVIILQGNINGDEWAFRSFWRSNQTSVTGGVKLPWNWPLNHTDIRGIIFPEVKNIISYFSSIFLPKNRYLLVTGVRQPDFDYSFNELPRYDYFGYKRRLTSDGQWTDWDEFMAGRIKLTGLFILNDILYGIGTVENMVYQFNENLNYIEKV